MRSTRVFIVVGVLCLLVASSSILTGFPDQPALTLAAIVLGTIMLALALVRARAETHRPVNNDPARGEHLVRVVTFGLAGLGVVAGLVALVVAVGEARGHAFIHLLTGLLCVGLFTVLAFPWRPSAGSRAATLRGLVLTVLAVAAFGSFLESLGGAGYDAANDGRRIAALALLHDIALPLGAFLIAAVPLGVTSGIGVLIAQATRRGRTVRT